MTEPDSGDINIEVPAAQIRIAGSPGPEISISGIAALLNAIAPSKAERIAAESLIEDHLSKMSTFDLRLRIASPRSFVGEYDCIPLTDDQAREMARVLIDHDRDRVQATKDRNHLIRWAITTLIAVAAFFLALLK